MEQVPETATYNAFISYRAVDTMNTLASHIYNRLREQGLHVFLDKTANAQEENISTAIQRAIGSASVHIVLFSRRYAESRQCLEELCSIIGSHGKIIPVFLDVEPSDLRYPEEGCYAVFFQKHNIRFPLKIHEWKNALRQVADISGFVIKTRESDFGEFVEDLGNLVLKVVNKESLQLETDPVFGKSLPPEIYEVFVSHRGPDAKLTHASLIYHSLKRCGLHVFMDQKELRTGDTLSPAIEAAIRSSYVHIIIFSENFAASRWCLEELRWILKSFHERKTSIVPMFCDVEPANLRDITRGPYAESFDKHKLRRRVMTTEWEKALKEAADFSGIMVKTNQSDYGMYLEHIVITVFKEVKRREPLEVATHPVGLKKAAMDFQNNIGNLNDTTIVGIAGMGGLGKSTLAKHLYNEKRSDFTRSSILLNVRGRDLPSLQEQLIRDLLMDHDLHIDNAVQGKGILQRSLPALQALIVLDDVDDVEQIHNLLDMDAVGSGTLILLTSRDKELLRRSSPKTVLYDVKPLNRQHAQELFCRHAFLLPEPVEGFEDLVGEFLKICDGLPSSLRALGRHLAGKDDKTYWKLQAEKFSRRLPDDIINTLKVSYEALQREEQEMFLDIGCFLVGEDRELAVRVLEGLGYSDVRDCLESLHQKCLLEYNYEVENAFCNNKNYKYEHFRVKMHNQVKGLARHIAREEFFEFAKHKPFRLSCSSDIREAFQLQDGSKYCLTRGIRIPEGQNPPQLTNNMNIKGVRLLVLDHPMDLSSIAMSGALIWLRLNGFPSISLPSTMSRASITVLEVHCPGDDCKELLETFDALPRELRELNGGASGAASTSASSSRDPFNVGHYRDLCTNISSTLEGAMPYLSGFAMPFPIDFGEIKNLRHLDLSSCTNLTELPKSFSELLHLQHLSLQYCINLSIPSDILGGISTLEYVDFKGCAKLVHLPEGMANQMSLKYLNLELCLELKTLPDLSHLVHLRFLNTNGCVKLETPNLECPRSKQSRLRRRSKQSRLRRRRV